MNLAKVSANGQITLPVEIRRTLGLESGDKVLFIQNSNGEIILSNAEVLKPLTKGQFLDELAISRNQSENGQCQNAKKSLKGLREKYGI